ncbi:hypothetical protein EXU57_13400 [Segetibacter sp. 3557_3]|uniref:hypothetical protein n=1 Tax=Segetibacter sp. 3557_3 TaxID=2547429 RepID=UPI0010587EE9|nr:hypothetical protein [Segetibacter sp. 3557_3]TDH25103.1 hypothetical protein EXU57_13400 [Segetibacter sp. 3557_3]
MYVFKISAGFILLLILALGCRQKTKSKYPVLPNYDLNNPYTYNLRDELDEISGMVYYPKDTSVFAINDENGLLYKIFLRKNVQVMKWTFAKDADFEDIALVDSTFYVLQSNGNITSFKVLTADSVVVDKCKRPYEGKNEFESMYYDAYYKVLVLICKDCEIDDKKGITAWSFDPATHKYSDTPIYVIKTKPIDQMLGVQKEKFKPSAAAIHPITKELYIVFSVNKAIVIADRSGVVKFAVPLDPLIYKQPEGITFTPKGDLLISNESAETGPGNILVLKQKSTVP